MNKPSNINPMVEYVNEKLDTSDTKFVLCLNETQQKTQHNMIRNLISYKIPISKEKFRAVYGCFLRSKLWKRCVCRDVFKMIISSCYEIVNPIILDEKDPSCEDTIDLFLKDTDELRVIIMTPKLYTFNFVMFDTCVRNFCIYINWNQYGQPLGRTPPGYVKYKHDLKEKVYFYLRYRFLEKSYDLYFLPVYKWKKIANLQSSFITGLLDDDSNVFSSIRKKYYQN